MAIGGVPIRRHVRVQRVDQWQRERAQLERNVQKLRQWLGLHASPNCDDDCSSIQPAVHGELERKDEPRLFAETLQSEEDCSEEDAEEFHEAREVMTEDGDLIEVHEDDEINGGCVGVEGSFYGKLLDASLIALVFFVFLYFFRDESL